MKLLDAATRMRTPHVRSERPTADDVRKSMMRAANGTHMTGNFQVLK
jgi:hypothetical protein